MKTYLGNCINNPFRNVTRLCKIIDTAKKISKKRFLENCELDKETLSLIKQYPNDFTFSENKEIMFFTHSCIETFFK